MVSVRKMMTRLEEIRKAIDLTEDRLAIQSISVECVMASVRKMMTRVQEAVNSKSNWSSIWVRLRTYQTGTNVREKQKGVHPDIKVNLQTTYAQIEARDSSTLTGDNNYVTRRKSALGLDMTELKVKWKFWKHWYNWICIEAGLQVPGMDETFAPKLALWYDRELALCDLQLQIEIEVGEGAEGH